MMAVNPNPSSMAGRMAERIRAAALSAAAQSTVVQHVHGVYATWRHLPWHERRLKGGAILVTAMIIHVLLLIRRAHGWTEFLIPVTILVIGFVAMASSLLRAEQLPQHE